MTEILSSKNGTDKESIKFRKARATHSKMSSVELLNLERTFSLLKPVEWGS